MCEFNLFFAQAQKAAQGGRADLMLLYMMLLYMFRLTVGFLLFAPFVLCVTDQQVLANEFLLLSA